MCYRRAIFGLVLVFGCNRAQPSNLESTAPGELAASTSIPKTTPAPAKGDTETAPAPAIPPATEVESPVCALLDPEKEPRVALLEVKLLTDPAATWVERQNVDAVLKERQVQALFSPRGVGDRIALGKLLKAKLLVMIRRVKEVKEPTLEVIVSETTGGLRLAISAVRMTNDADADVAALKTAVRDGIGKGRAPVRGVVAVPPFVNHDLSYEADHLKSAYAKLVETMVMTRPGVVAVELAEAEAIAKEVALTAPGEALNRPLPVYLFGEYRHDGKGKDRTLTLTLKAERAGKAIGKPTEKKGNPDDAPSAIREWVKGVLDDFAGTANLVADPKAEAKQLTDRAGEFKRIGNWAECAALLDAAILLDPDHFDRHLASLLPLTRMLTQLNERQSQRLSNGVQSPEPETIREAYRLQRRGLNHVEALVGRDEYLPKFRTEGFGVHFEFLGELRRWTDWTSSPSEAELEMQAECRVVLLQLLPRVARMDLFLHEQKYIEIAFKRVSPKEKYASVERLILQCKDLPKAKARSYTYAVFARTLPSSPSGASSMTVEGREYRDFLGRLEAAESADVRAAAADLRKREADLAKRPGTPSPVAKGDLLPIRALNLIRDSDGRPVDDVTGVRAIGPKLDVVWGTHSPNLYLMKKKGTLRAVWSGSAEISGILDVCFDGRYVWALAHQKGRRFQLLVLDPETEKAWEATAFDSLPEANRDAVEGLVLQTVRISSAGSGRLCVVGSFGRTWVATASFDPSIGKATVKVIHEAREAQDATRAEQMEQTTVDFQPAFAFTLAGPPKPDGMIERRVVIGRGVAIAGAGKLTSQLIGRPLVIDPDRGSVSVLKGFSEPQTSFLRFNFLAATDREAYGIRIARPKGMPPSCELLRMGMPDLAWKSIGPARPANPPLKEQDSPSLLASTIHDGRIHCIVLISDFSPQSTGSHLEWWVAALDGTGARQMGSKFMQILISDSSLYSSSHFGPVLNLENGLHSLEFSDPNGK